MDANEYRKLSRITLRHTLKEGNVAFIYGCIIFNSHSWMFNNEHNSYIISTSTKYWPLSTSWRLRQGLYMTIEKQVTTMYSKMSVKRSIACSRTLILSIEATSGHLCFSDVIFCCVYCCWCFEYLQTGVLYGWFV